MSKAGQGDGTTLYYTLILHTREDAEEDLYRVKLVCGPGDDAAPVITLMRPEED